MLQVTHVRHASLIEVVDVYTQPKTRQPTTTETTCVYHNNSLACLHLYEFKVSITCENSYILRQIHFV